MFLQRPGALEICNGVLVAQCAAMQRVEVSLQDIGQQPRRISAEEIRRPIFNRLEFTEPLAFSGA